MIQNICNTLKNEKISTYKIVKKVCEKKSFSRVYGEKVFKRENMRNYLIRFLNEDKIKEIEVQSDSLMLTDNMISYLKDMPGEVSKRESYSLESSMFNSNEEQRNLSDGYIIKILTEMKNCNVVIEQESYYYEWYSLKEKHEQKFIRYNLFFLDLSTNYFMNTSFFEAEKWKDIYYKLNRCRENKMQLQEIDKRKTYEISPKAMSKILRKIARLFCADSIWNGESTLCDLDIEKEKFPSYINFISAPIKGILFDAEGNQIKEKHLIERGIVKNFLSNTYYSSKLQNAYPGNAGIIDLKEVECYSIKFYTKVEVGQEGDFVIGDFESIELERDVLKGVALYKGEETVKFSIELSVHDFFEHVAYKNCNYTWNDNCWTTSGLLSFN